jgi:hypothetical protein
MSDSVHGSPEGGPAHRSVEVGTAIGMGVFALVVIAGSVQAGIGWGDEGPRAGFFPFYVGLTVLIASVINLIQGWQAPADRLFADWTQLRQVLAVVVPSAIYVAVMPWTGIYLSSGLLIAFFMRRLGNYAWPLIAAIAVGIPVITFVVFERWFLVPLPKGPIEMWLGF